MAEQIINQDPIDIVTWRLLPDGQVEALLRLSERDKHLLEDRSARYSIAPNPPRYVVDGMLLDGGPVGEAAEEGRDIEAHLQSPRYFYYWSNWPSTERCHQVWIETDNDDTEHRCVLVKGHPGGCSFRRWGS